MLSNTNRYAKQQAKETRDDLLAEASMKKADQLALADELERWLASNLGTAFTKRVNRDKSVALGELATVNPTDINKITELQSQVKMINRIQLYMSEIILAAKLQN